MTLVEALENCKPNQCITRQKWLDCGLTVRLLSSVKIIEELDITLTEESTYANDWVIINFEYEEAI